MFGIKCYGSLHQTYERTEEDLQHLIAYTRDKFGDERYPFAPAPRPIRDTLAKLDPKPKPEPLPPKKPYVPSLVLQRKNKRRR